MDRFRLKHTALLALTATALAGCGTSSPRSSAAAAPVHLAGVTPASQSAPNMLPAFAGIIKGAKQTDGLFSLWQRDERVWLELKPDDFDKPFFLSPKFASGIGEGGLFGGLMARSWGESYGKPQVVAFRRVHNQVQLVALNTAFHAKAGTPEALAVQAAFSPSLLGSSPVLSQPHPERKTVLIDASGLFVSDMLGVGMLLQRNYRQGYGFDSRHSAITHVRGRPDEVAFDVLNHYATSSLAPATPGGASLPGSLPDARSLFVTMHYSLARLPAEVMAPRKADARVGYFTTNVNDFGDDLARSPKLRYVNRWRLEKADPAAALSEPVKPITFWLDRTIPEQYRAPITEGVLEWNKAFERIGFKNAVVVKLQPKDGDFDTLDFGQASIRWMTNSSPTFGAIGPTHVDPRSGEILDADIGIESLSSRAVRNLRTQVLGGAMAMQWPGLEADTGAASHSHDALLCAEADMAGEQLGYALDVLEARGEIAADSEQAQQFVRDYLKETTMHEVGHTLGLRHNFRASTVYTEQELADPAFTRTHGNSGSVMEYAPINLGRPGEKGGTAFQTTLGPYDYWAIEYAYKPVASEAEGAELARIAARSGEAELAYGTDEDNFLGVDPGAVQFDLGRDVLAFARKRIEIARDLLKRQETRQLKADEDYSVLRRSVSYALRDVSRAASVLARQIGGVRTLRDFPGSGRDPLVPVPAAQQREALDLLTRGVLSADAFHISPALARRLAPDFQERTDAVFEGEGAVQTDFSLDGMVLSLQRALLAQLMSDTVVSRIVDSEGKAKPGDAFHLSELYHRLDRELWSELQARGDIAPLRRELQREHVNRLAGLLLRPTAFSRSDARSLMRAEAQGLLQRIRQAANRRDLSPESRAHLADSADTLAQALSARMLRAGL
jgi:hypothetical protein